MSVEYFDEQRRQLIAAIRAHRQVATQIGKTALDKRVLRTMTKVPRHEFVPAELQPSAYLDTPLPWINLRCDGPGVNATKRPLPRRRQQPRSTRVNVVALLVVELVGLIFVFSGHWSKG